MSKKRNEGLVENYPVKSSSSSPVGSRGRTYDRGIGSLTSSRDGLNDDAPEGTPLEMEDINSRASKPERSFKDA